MTSPVQTAGSCRPALCGHLRLAAAVDSTGRTAIAGQSFQAPFHISKPYWDGHVLQVQVVNPTAGILEGDRLELEITAEAGASLLVTTPAATRTFMMRGGSALCRQSFIVRSGAWLEYVPEPLFPHRDADYAQATTLVVEAGAQAVYFDALAPGRVGRGERWAWRRLSLTLDLEYAGERVLRERLDCSGAEMARMAAFHRTPDAFCGTMVILTDRIDAADPVLDSIRGLHGDNRWLGVTALRRGGWIVRFVVPSGQAVRDTVKQLRSLLASRLPGLGSDLRKL